MIDIVINNGGVLTRTRSLDAHCVEQLQYEMNVKVYGLIHLAQVFGPLSVSFDYLSSIEICLLNMRI